MSPPKALAHGSFSQLVAVALTTSFSTPLEHSLQLQSQIVELPLVPTSPFAARLRLPPFRPRTAAPAGTASGPSPFEWPPTERTHGLGLLLLPRVGLGHGLLDARQQLRPPASVLRRHRLALPPGRRRPACGPQSTANSGPVSSTAGNARSSNTGERGLVCPSAPPDLGVYLSVLATTRARLANASSSRLRSEISGGNRRGLDNTSIHLGYTGNRWMGSITWPGASNSLAYQIRLV